MKTNKTKLASYFGAGTLAGAPANSVAPSITGTAQVGQTLTAMSGTWSGSPTFTRQWRANGIDIFGATSTTLVLTAAQLGKTITVALLGANANGAVPAVSAPTAAVIA